MPRYQDIYPSAPLLESARIARPRAAELLSLEYFEAEPASMPTERFDQHHILVNLKDEPHRVENWRNGAHRDFVFHRSEIVVTPAGVESGWRWHAKSRVIVITCDPAAFDRFARHEVGVLLTDQQLRDEPQFVDADITAAAESLLGALRAEGPGSAVMYESLARIFLVKLIQKYGLEKDGPDRFTPSFSARHYHDVLDHVARHFDRAITVEELAAQAGLSPYHFARLFKATIGESPHQFVTTYRVEQAQRMLAEPSRSMIEIAIACGFSDQAHFSRTFKKRLGVTPTGYRASL